MRPVLATLVSVVVLLGTASASASAAVPSTVDAASAPALIAGAQPGDHLMGVSNAGDVNGDGRDDLLATVSVFGGLGTLPVSRAYVVFGDGSDAPVDLAHLGARGFEIDGPIADVVSFWAAPGGDINGDGRADIIAGDSFATAAGRTHGGRIFVVFGKTGTGTVDLNALGSGGFEIVGSQAEAFATSTSNVGDLNGDGRDEVLVNESGIDRATVVYGRTATATVDLAAIGSGGYRITGPANPGVEFVHRVGDVNGDGLDDIGVAGGCGGVSCPAGRTWISFGKSDTAPVDLSALGTGGFVITGNGLADVDPAGDVNGDGRADILVSDPNAARGFVVFGRTDTTPLSFGALGTAGYPITDATDGARLAGVGDIDGDGLDDLATPGSTAGGTQSAILFGKADATPIGAADLDRGFRVAGGHVMGAANAGSFTAEPRIAVSLPSDSPLGRAQAGSIRLIGPPAPAFDLPAKLVYTAGGAIAPVTPANVRRSSPVRYSVTPALPAGLSLDPDTGAISGTPAQGRPAATYVIHGADRAGATDRQVSLRIDPDAYAVTAPQANATTRSQPVFAWTRASAPDDTEPVTGYRVMLDGVQVARLGAGSCGATRCTVAAPSAIADGVHTLRIETTARDGHVRRTPPISFTVVDPPRAGLALTRPAVMSGEAVGLDASQSFDPNGGIRSFAFDLDGNGSFESDNGADPRRTVSFDTIGDHPVSVRVTDAGGHTAVASATVHVTPAPAAGELGVSINDGAIATSDPNVTVTLVWPRLAETALMSNDGGFGAAGGTRLIGLAARVPWTLASSGPERMPKIVYVRFRGGESGRETYTDDIILDQRPPQVADASFAAAASAGSVRAARAAGRRAVLRVTGKDDNAGVRRIEVVKRRGGKPIATKALVGAGRRGKRSAKASVSVPASLRTVYVRAVDVAGNASSWRTVRRRAR